MKKTKRSVASALASFLRKLRKYLPGKVEKLPKGYTGWLIDNCVVVEVKYICEMGTNTVKGTCYPYSVKVYAFKKLTDYYGLRKRVEPNNKIFHPRIFRRRSDGTINIEGIAIAVSEAKEAFILEKKKRAAKEKAEEEGKKLVDRTIKNITKSTPKNHRKTKFRKNGFDYEKEGIDCSMDWYAYTNSEKQPRVSINIHDIKDPGVVSQIITYAHKLMF